MKIDELENKKISQNLWKHLTPVTNITTFVESAIY